MGYVACFVMPLILGIDVVNDGSNDMGVRKPELLFDCDRGACGTLLLHAQFRLRSHGAEPARSLANYATMGFVSGACIGSNIKKVSFGRRVGGGAV